MLILFVNAVEPIVSFLNSKHNQKDEQKVANAVIGRIIKYSIN